MAYHLSVFLVENKPGKLEKITRVLDENKINLRAMSLASAGDFGVVKLLVDNPDKAYEELKKQNFTVTKREIIAVEIDNVPGALHIMISKFSQNNINLEDCYGFLLGDGKTAAIILEIENKTGIGDILKNLGINVLDKDKIYSY
ncbi:MAG: hypothetical protein LBR69_01490 [Endomicrobium sp.]|jgi:hypothetical protein|nr:hypothetical protein [Endomicrobium sp.]